MGELFAIIQEDYYRAFRADRIFRDKTNPLDTFNDDQLIRRYRFPRSTLIQIMGLCHEDLSRATNRNCALPVYSQVLSALRFFAKGAFQVDAGDTENISQTSVSRAISNVTRILCENVQEFIAFPESTQKLNEIKFGFYNRYHMPNTIGAVDGTLISIKGPSGDQEPLYVSRKGGHAINVQLICDYNMFIIDLVVKWPGTTHDSFIWRNCGIREKFMDNPPNGWLLGDSGYPLEPWLLVPIQAPTNPKQENYNSTFKKARSKVENCIGLWKSVFRCIDKSGGVLQYKPDKVCKIIIASAVLHNLRRKLRLQVDDEFIAAVDDDDDVRQVLQENEVFTRGQQVRNNLVDEFF